MQVLHHYVVHLKQYIVSIIYYIYVNFILILKMVEIALWTGRGLMESWGGWVPDKEQNSEWSWRMIQSLPRQSRGLIQAKEENICWTGNQWSTLQRFLFSSVFVILRLVAIGKLDKPTRLLVYTDNIYPVTILFKLIATEMWIVAEETKLVICFVIFRNFTGWINCALPNFLGWIPKPSILEVEELGNKIFKGN